MTMGAERRRVVFSEGVHELGGYNLGEYPKHDFVFNHSMQAQTALPLKVMVVGRDEWIAGCYRYRKNSDIFAIELVTGGSVEFKQNGTLYHVGAGMVYMTHIGADNEKQTGEEGFCTAQTVIIAGTALESMLHTLNLSSVDVLRPSRVAIVSGLLEAMHQKSRQPEDDFMAECSALAYQLLLELGKDAGERGYPEALNRALALFSRSMGKRLTIGEICREAGTSPATISRLFQTYFRTSPIDFFLQQKIHAAQELLATQPMLAIKEISRRLGYSNQLYFSAEFKKNCGLSPSSYRQRHS